MFGKYFMRFNINSDSNYACKCPGINTICEASSLIVQYLKGCCCCSWVLRRSLTSQVISVAFYNEREKSDKFCTEVPISPLGSLTCLKSTSQEQRLHFPSEGRHTWIFMLWENPLTPAGFEPANLRSWWEQIWKKRFHLNIVFKDCDDSHPICKRIFEK